MELVSLRCNRDFTSASSYGLGWYKYAIATQWYQFHTTDARWFSLSIKYRWLNAGETHSRTLGNSCVSSASSHLFTLPCIRLIVSVITTDEYELYLCYVRGEQLDKLCFSSSHFIRYWKMQNYVHTQCVSCEKQNSWLVLTLSEPMLEYF